MKPTVGRIVHYRMRDTDLPLAALVVGTFLDGSASLAVFTGRSTFKGRAESLFQRAVPFSETPKAGHWSWPPRETT